MCTLSFIPHLNGYAVGMNRDELRSRPRALAPRYFECNGATAVYPSETLGGTWIAVNASGQLFALLNWYSADARTFTAKQRSRGEIIPQMIFDSDFRAAATILVSPRLAGILPFRLIGIDPKRRVISEWRWGDAASVDQRSHGPANTGFPPACPMFRPKSIAVKLALWRRP